MDIKSTAITAQMVIQSLVVLLENEDVDISTVKFKVGSDGNGYESPEFELERLIDLAIGGLGEIKESQAVPEGFVVVPKEPDADLVNHGHQVFLGHFSEGGQTGGRSLYFAYKAMIAAAQEQSHD